MPPSTRIQNTAPSVRMGDSISTNNVAPPTPTTRYMLLLALTSD